MVSIAFGTAFNTFCTFLIVLRSSCSDGDGISDAYEKETTWPVAPVDSDKDGIPDYRDTDSNGDGKTDKEQKGPDTCCAGNGATPPGRDTPIDSDKDGVDDYKYDVTTDDDNDGIPDYIEKGSDPSNPLDSDNDGTPDYLDLDR